ncbi:MAG: hypothetical protein ABDI19_07945, partial [Armatimonadota bacterium]
EAAGSRIASTLLTWLGALLAVSWLLTIVPEPLIQALGSGLIWINPLKGMSSSAYPIGHYAGYALYALLLAVGFAWFGIRRGRAEYAYLRQSVLPEGYTSQEHAGGLR